MNTGKWLLNISALWHHIISAVVKISQSRSVQHIREELLLAFVVHVDATGFEICGSKSTLRIIMLLRLEFFVLFLDDFIGLASNRVLADLLASLIFINELHIVSIFINGLLVGDKLFSVNR